MHGQRFVAEACTEPAYRLYDLGGYPGMVAVETEGLCIKGEIWEVDETSLARLDELEDIEGGEYTREVVKMRPPHEYLKVEGYRYLLSVNEQRDLGRTW